MVACSNMKETSTLHLHLRICHRRTSRNPESTIRSYINLVTTGKYLIIKTLPVDRKKKKAKLVKNPTLMPKYTVKPSTLTILEGDKIRAGKSS